MEDWKIRQEIYHRINPIHTDDLNNFTIELTDDVVRYAVEYFNSRDLGWVYPSKSYMVGICYARFLAEQFGGRPLEYLEDPDLLYGNDPYFVEYSRDPKTYHQILIRVGWEFDVTKGMVPDVYEYFKEEFMI
jgi:hypothetical protein